MSGRKRKRPPGEYLDEETGEFRAVPQTSKQAKRAHQKSGKHYKEPTEAELRAWDRQEKQQEAADRMKKAEDNKRNIARKRETQAAKEAALKQELYELGKIAFTQTLAKKDEDQLNLHQWFGRPGANAPSKPCTSKKENIAPPVPDAWSKPADGKQSEQGNMQGQLRTRNVYVQGTEVAHTFVRSLSQEHAHAQDSDDDHEFDEVDQAFFDDNILVKDNEILKVPSGRPITTVADLEMMDQLVDQANMDDMDLSQLLEDFDIRADSDIEAELLEADRGEKKQPEQDTSDAFKIPALPARTDGRLPLSPVSEAQLNARAGQSLANVSNFKDKLAKSNVALPAPTQAVREVMAVVCTQDLDFSDEDLEVAEKENTQPGDDRNKHTLPAKKITRFEYESTAELMQKITTSSRPMPTLAKNESFEFEDNIFAGLAEHDFDADADDEDDELDEEEFDWKSLPPATQMFKASKIKTTSARPAQVQSRPARTTVQPATVPPPLLQPAPTVLRSSTRPLKASDSFAMPDLSDDDLMEGLEEFEKSQKSQRTPPASTTTTSVATTSTRKRGKLPWEQSPWQAKTTAGALTQALDNVDDGSQATEILEDTQASHGG
ncbi:hypothetical protein LTR66_014581 [Elasticomyces elasticus]|nr:hypothetical protein LTR66_014581 [Elasticomyces elasticus]